MSSQLKIHRLIIDAHIYAQMAIGHHPESGLASNELELLPEQQHK